MSHNHWKLASTALGAVTYALATAATCHDYVLISTRGTFEKQGPSVGFTGMINATLASFPNIIEYDTVYPATPDLTKAFDGVADVERYIKTGIEDCPDQKYALLGYSQGASVNNIALRNFTDPDSAAYKAILAVLVIGNPGHIAGAEANVDQYGGDTTRNGTGWVLVGGNGTIPQLYYDDHKVLDICYQGDTVCELSPNGTGGVSPPHLLYGSTPTVQTMGAEFLIEKLDEGSPSLNQMVAAPSNCTSAAPSSSTSAVAYTGSATLLSPWSRHVAAASLALAVFGFAL